MTSATHERADRYARWVERRRRVILTIGAVIATAGTALAWQMPLRADLSNLLPPHERSVRDLERIQNRTQSLGLVLIAIASADPALRAEGARAVVQRLSHADPALVAGSLADDGIARRFAWDHKFLNASLADLQSASDALRTRIRRAELRANPLFVALDDDRDGLDQVLERLDQAERDAATAKAIVSQDQTLQLVVVQAPFPSASVTQGQHLIALLDSILSEVRRELGPGIELGLTEDIVIAVAEHRAVLDGMMLAVLLTVTVVAASLYLYFRSVPALLALFATLAVGTMATFGIARVTIGHLNSVSAFLSSIVVGNGINFPILVLARHFEARRRGQGGRPALAEALAGTFTGTLTAAAGAAIAYTSLVVTDFRGFRDFGIIGGIGMLSCWGASYTVLPALLSALEHRRWLRPRSEPRIGSLIARLSPARWELVLMVAGSLVVAAAGVTVRFVAADPLEYDWQRMRSDSPLARDARTWMTRIDRAFGRQLTGGFMVGTDTVSDAERVERVLRAHAEDEPGGHPEEALFRRVSSIRDLVPRDQLQKLAVLAEIRASLDSQDLSLLDPKDAADARRFRPPAELRLLTEADVPEPLARRYAERNGDRGRLLMANQAARFDGWNGRDMIAFADQVRALELPESTVFAGGAFVFADIMRAVVRAGPRATLTALLGVTVMVLVILGPGRHALTTLTCLIAGTLLMIAAAVILGLKVNFLDFIALPITVGIGVDYAVNVVTRERAEGPGRVRAALATTGGAVALCSWTTMAGYGSLLLSPNAGIRSFGMTAILGEATCLLVALSVAPALLTALTRRPPRSPPPDADQATGERSPSSRRSLRQRHRTFARGPARL